MRNDLVYEELDTMREVAYNSCPQIIEMHEIFEDIEFYYIVTKFYQGGNLHDYIRQMPNLPFSEAHGKVIIK